jgi:multicomponent Na+:H+ antiporter subunit C
MEIVLAIVIGGLYACAFYMLLRRSLVKLLIGLALLSHATNLLIFTAGGITRGSAPVLTDEVITPDQIFADPLPQALILTAIVIGLGVIAFALSMAFQTYRKMETDDLDQIKGTD